jgi:hypothetical protein
MAATKTRRQLLAAATALAINASVNATEWNNSTAYFGGRLIVRITYGASVPTIAPVVTYYTGGVTGEKIVAWAVAATVTASSTVDVPSFVTEQGDMFLNVNVALGAATNGCTVEIIALEATSL